MLLAHALGVTPARLLTAGPLHGHQIDAFDDLVRARVGGTPAQYLTGRAPFRTVEVAVGPGVFIPRPETEVMTGWALDRLAEVGESPLVVELCAGSGAISAACAPRSLPVRRCDQYLSPLQQVHSSLTEILSGCRPSCIRCRRSVSLRSTMNLPVPG